MASDKQQQSVSVKEWLDKAENIPEDLLDRDTHKNRQWIVCRRCNSRILRPCNAEYHAVEFKLPSVGPKARVESGKFREDTLRRFWVVHDMMTFENIGFTNTLNNIKYLICADCETGPIGFQDLSDMKTLYVAFDRVGHRFVFECNSGKRLTFLEYGASLGLGDPVVTLVT